MVIASFAPELCLVDRWIEPLICVTHDIVTMLVSKENVQRCLIIIKLALRLSFRTPENNDGCGRPLFSMFDRSSTTSHAWAWPFITPLMKFLHGIIYDLPNWSRNIRVRQQSYSYVLLIVSVLLNEPYFLWSLHFVNIRSEYSPRVSFVVKQLPLNQSITVQRNS